MAERRPRCVLVRTCVDYVQLSQHLDMSVYLFNRYIYIYIYMYIYALRDLFTNNLSFLFLF